MGSFQLRGPLECLQLWVPKIKPMSPGGSLGLSGCGTTRWFSALPHHKVPSPHRPGSFSSTLLLVPVAPIQAESALRGHPGEQRGALEGRALSEGLAPGQRGAQRIEDYTPEGGQLGLEGGTGHP